MKRVNIGVCPGLGPLKSRQCLCLGLDGLEYNTNMAEVTDFDIFDSSKTISTNTAARQTLIFQHMQQVLLLLLELYILIVSSTLWSFGKPCAFDKLGIRAALRLSVVCLLILPVQ